MTEDQKQRECDTFIDKGRKLLTWDIKIIRIDSDKKIKEKLIAFKENNNVGSILFVSSSKNKTWEAYLASGINNKLKVFKIKNNLELSKELLDPIKKNILNLLKHKENKLFERHVTLLNKCRRKALEYFNKALQLDPHNEKAQLLKSVTLNFMGQFEEALDCISQINDFNFIDIIEDPAKLLIYPTEGFNGDLDLQEIRREINKKFNIQKRIAANFIGIPLCNFNRYLTKSPYHKFSIERGETYHRSANNPLALFTSKDATYERKSLTGTEAAHLGLFKNPIEALNSRILRDNKNISIISTKTPSHKSKEKIHLTSNSYLYDDILKHKREMCQYIVNEYIVGECRINQPIKPGFYNNYPCVMVFINNENCSWIPKEKNKPSNSALEGWTQIIISYFTAIVNFEAQKINLNIELVRRSSFGHIIPTIAYCGLSFRINIGIVPKKYADILIMCLKNLNSLLNYIYNNPQKSKEINSGLPVNIFLDEPSFQVYKGIFEKPNTIFELIFFKAEKEGKTTAQNFMRTPFGHDWLSAEIYKNLHPDSPIKHVKHANAFLDALRTSFSKIHVINGILSFNQESHIQFHSTIDKQRPCDINDNVFWKLIKKILSSVNKILDKINDEIQKINIESTNIINKLIESTNIINKLIEYKHISYSNYIGNIDEIVDNRFSSTPAYEQWDLYYYLEIINELLYSFSITEEEDSKDDYYGSDSETENSLEEEPSEIKIYGKKIILKNGMRAIIASLNASKEILNCKNVYLHGAYYETEDALDILKKFDEVKDPNNMDILFYDINSCITDGKPLPQLNITTKFKVLIIDSTSATTDEYRNWIKIFQNNKHIKFLFFVSSGLKNEQMGADKNSYGTIRIFTKNSVVNKKILNEIIESIKKDEKPIESLIAHSYRRLMKSMGNLPINANIMKTTQLQLSTRENAKKASSLTSSDDENLILPDALSLSNSFD